MIKRIGAVLCACLCLAAAKAQADGVTLKTVSTFAGTDAASGIYTDLLKNWEEQTGNTVIDESATSSETWKMGVLKDFAAGNEADVLFFFAQTSDSKAILSRVTPIKEINAAYPGLGLTVDEAVAEDDGVVYAIPVRPFWEGLFCNADLFEQYGVELPTTWDKLVNAIVVFRRAGIVPISVSLSDLPHYIVEFCILASATPQEQMARPKAGESVPQSWIDGMALIQELYRMGAFSVDVNATTEAAASQLFRDKGAAMQIDGSWFANSLPPENMDTTVVLPFPTKAEGAEPSYIYGVSMGFYLTRAAWDDLSRRDAAVDLLHYLSTGGNVEALGEYTTAGRMLSSFQAMMKSAARRCSPIQDDMNRDARARWFAMIPGIAEGTLDPADMWTEIMGMAPFGQ